MKKTFLILGLGLGTIVDPNASQSQAIRIQTSIKTKTGFDPRPRQHQDKPVPTAIFHGVRQTCHEDLLKNLVDQVQKGTKGEVECIEIGQGDLTSIFTTMDRQAEEACKHIKEHKVFGENEFNVIGLSQGGLIARYIVETCETKFPVRNLVTVGTPNNGIDYEENCTAEISKLKKVAEEAQDKIMKEFEKVKNEESVNKLKDAAHKAADAVNTAKEGANKSKEGADKAREVAKIVTEGVKNINIDRAKEEAEKTKKGAEQAKKGAEDAKQATDKAKEGAEKAKEGAEKAKEVVSNLKDKLHTLSQKIDESEAQSLFAAKGNLFTDQYTTRCEIQEKINTYHINPYADIIQTAIGPSNYLKDHRHLSEYAEKSKFLPYLNNEKDHPKKNLNKERFTKLNSLLMIKFKWDPMVFPKESSWFGENNGEGKEMPMEQTKIFKEDTFGLKTLNDQGRLDKKEIEGVHLQFNNKHIQEIIVQALVK